MRESVRNPRLGYVCVRVNHVQGDTPTNQVTYHSPLEGRRRHTRYPAEEERVVSHDEVRPDADGFGDDFRHAVDGQVSLNHLICRISNDEAHPVPVLGPIGRVPLVKSRGDV